MSKWSETIKQGLLRGVTVLAFGLACLAESAQATPLVGPTGGRRYYFDPNSGGGVAGFQFTSHQTVSVTRLGVFDFGMDGLQGSHMVGLFDVGGTLLTSATVEMDAPMDTDGYRWEDLAAPYLMAANREYVLGALYAGTGINDRFMGSALIIYPFEVTVQQGLYASDSTLTMPVNPNPYFDEGFFGPNLDTAPVPEPSTLVLLGAGLAGIVLAARRRKS